MSGNLLTKKVLMLGTIALTLGIFSLGVSQKSVAADSRTQAETFYVSQTGSDSASGTSEAAPWNIDKVNSTTFIPGDKILLKRGDNWKGVALKPKGSGNDSANITISAYGSGDLPKLEGAGEVSDVLTLNNQHNWTIEDLDISNTTEGFDNNGNTDNEDNENKLHDLRGIHITGEGQTLSGFKLTNLNVHDVSGTVKSIGWGETAVVATHEGGNTKNYGVNGGAGWDGSKKTGGIIFDVQKPQGDTPTIFKDVDVSNNIISHCSYSAFAIKQWYGADGVDPKWAGRSDNATAPNYEDANFKPHQNIAVSNNYIDQSGTYNLDGIYVTSSQNVNVDNNIVKNPGASGIELYFVDHATIQNNDISGARPKPSAQDSNAIDPDRNTTNVVIQYNYIHNNGDGIMTCGFAYNSAVIRYNLFKDNTGLWLHDYVKRGWMQAYNNIFYNTLPQETNNQDDALNNDNLHVLRFLNSNTGHGSSDTDTWLIANNVFFNTNDKIYKVLWGADSDSNKLENNAYYGPAMTAAPNDKKAITKDPLFANDTPKIPDSGSSIEQRTKNFDFFKLQSNSPLIHAGTVVTTDPTQFSMSVNGLDYAGVSVGDTPDIGMYQYQGTISPVTPNDDNASNNLVTTGSITGTSDTPEALSTSSSTQTDTNNEQDQATASAQKQTTVKKVTPFKVMAVKSIYQYSKPTFAKKNRIKYYPKTLRYKAPVFTVVGTDKSVNNVLRYRLSNGHYITAKKAYVVKLYLQGNHHALKVINPSGIWVHSQEKFTKKNASVKYKKSTTIKVKKVIRYGSVSRYLLADGNYITGNKQYVQVAD